LGRKEDLIEAIAHIKQRDGLEQLLLCVVDILEEKNTAIVAGEHEAAIVQ
jgi:inorganic pyrophosphatase/exopolyphosphatase